MHRSKTAVKKLKNEFTLLQKLRLIPFETHCLHAVRFCKGLILFQKTGSCRPGRPHRCGGGALLRGTRKIPVQYAKQATGGAAVSGARQYLPLKVNAANVMPIIFAQAIMFIPMAIMGFNTESAPSAFAQLMYDNTSWLYNLIFAFLIIVFTYFYTAITINPMQMAEDMKRNNGFIPGIKPGALKDAKIDENAMAKTEAIILSMTPYERENPNVLNASRKRRIARGAGVSVVDVNRVLKQYETMQQMMKQMNGAGKRQMKKMNKKWKNILLQIFHVIIYIVV